MKPTSSLRPRARRRAFDTARRNLLRFRTFSKAHGMAGIRVGYVVGEAGMIAAFDRIRNHFGISRISQAGAIAAIGDTERGSAHVKPRGLHGPQAHPRDRGGERSCTALPSATNFMAVDCGRDGTFARAIVDGLLQHGIFIRMPGVAPLNRCIRISCGTGRRRWTPSPRPCLRS
jgi:histidinol-phosphate aminotransferase